MIDLDVVIFGGGVAGLWLLDELDALGYRSLLLESHRLGQGQTSAAQGIIHGGLKYTLKGLFTGSADAIKQMPQIWRRCLEGTDRPRLNHTRVRSQHCHLWHTKTAASRLGMFGAKSLLQVTPIALDRQDWPQVLEQCQGQVYRLDEQVIDPVSLVSDLANQHGQRILKVSPEPGGVRFNLNNDGLVEAIQLTDPATNQEINLHPHTVVFTAGAGNEKLRQQAGLTGQAMQRRPLHMVMVRGDLPVLNGHCVDGSKTKVTITTDKDAQGRTVWQVGGQLAEEGVAMEPSQLLQHAKKELATALGGFVPQAIQWSSYRVDRAEAVTPSGVRPNDAAILQEGNVMTAWPTKLALAPNLASGIKNRLAPPSSGEAIDLAMLKGWPRPEVCPPPWELQPQWNDDL